MRHSRSSLFWSPCSLASQSKVAQSRVLLLALLIAANPLTRAQQGASKNETSPSNNTNSALQESQLTKIEDASKNNNNNSNNNITDRANGEQQRFKLDGRQQAEEPTAAYYQPALIGFRCDIASDITANGVSVIEANLPVTLTLYGESFTTETIVAFTTEFKPDTERADPTQSTFFQDLTKPQALQTDAEQLEQEPASLISVNSAQLAEPSTTTSGKQQAAANDVAAANEQGEPTKTSTRFANRRRTRSKSYDCTDYNRVRSYKLSEANVLSPNVAVLRISLPELDVSSGDLYYYFCIKQPPISAAGEQTGASNGSQLVWVHQGDEWWVTLKVEPPLLSMANDLVLITLLLFLSAVTSGLNLGLMSLDMNELAVISSCGDQRERSYARTIAPLRRRGNFLLCSLLLGNVMVNSTLTVILEEMTSGLVAVIGSTLAIVVLGEIVPQAMCARHGLAVGAKTIYLTYGFMIITFPLSYPISRLLDYFLGEEKGNVYDRERLMEFIKITGHHTQLEADEVAIISGALKLKKIKVDQIMTRIEDVFMLPIDCQLNRETIKQIIEKGYSRIPVHEYGDRRQIVALILAKDLALIDPDDHTPIANMLMYCKHPLIFIDDDTTLDVALNEFKTGKSHMAVVRQIYDDGETDKYYEAIGVVTLEDVIEEVLQVEINDETDTLSDNRRKRRRTDAQVAHLIDQFTCRSLSTGTATNTASNGTGSYVAGCGGPVGLHNKLLDVAAAAGGSFELSSDDGAAGQSKVEPGLLSTQLTAVSIEGVAHSLAQAGTPTANRDNNNPVGANTPESEACTFTTSQQSNPLHYTLAHSRLSLSESSQHQQHQQQHQQQQQPQGEGGAGAVLGYLSGISQFMSNLLMRGPQ